MSQLHDRTIVGWGIEELSGEDRGCIGGVGQCSFDQSIPYFALGLSIRVVEQMLAEQVAESVTIALSEYLLTMISS